MTEAAVVVSETPPSSGSSDENRSLASDAWRSLRGNPIFWASAVLIAIFVTMAIFFARA